MSMEPNEPQTTQGQQTAPPVVLSPAQDGAFAATSNGPGQQQRRRRRRRKAGKSANPAQGGSSGMPGGTGGAGAEAAGPSPGSDDGESAADPVRTETRMENREQTREQTQPLPRDASGPQPSRDQQQPRQARNNQQNHQKKQQRQAKNGSQGGSGQGGSGQGGSSQGGSSQGGSNQGGSSQNGSSQNGSSQGRHFQKGGAQPREYNPGNATTQAGSQPGNGGVRRKNKVRRQAPSFVGPMDHSYRVVNGNIADGPPSTMDFRSNGNGNGNVHGRNGYSDFLDAPIPVIIREDAPSRILCFIEDLFVVAKMQETARKLGVKVSFAKAEKDTITRLTEAPELERPSLIVFDLNNANAKPLTLIPKLKAKLKRSTSIIGFLSHIQGDLKMKAIEAGCDTVMPKAAFSQNLPNLLRRHGLDEELEEAEGW